MIPQLPGWSWELRHDAVVTAPPEGKAAGYVRYVERQRPLRRVRDLVRQLEQDPRFRITDVGRPERIVTEEGEYGALVTVDGMLLEAPVRHVVGFVFLDDFYSMTDALALRPDQVDRWLQQVRGLVVADAHMLGELRRRRYFYEGPAGWSGVASSLHAYWFPPDYPRNPTSLTIVPAVPVPPGGAASFIDVLMHGHYTASGMIVDSVSDPWPVSTKNRLSGSMREVVGRVDESVLYRDVVVLEDGRFAYTVVLESPRERHEDNLVTMRSLIDTIETIPRGAENVPEESTDSMGHWAE